MIPSAMSSTSQTNHAYAGLRDALDRASCHVLSLQRKNGCWEGEMVWCTMILSQYVIVQRVVGRSFDEATRSRIIHQYEVTRTNEGTWGLHPESRGYVFTTVLAYVALRLLGVGPDDPLIARARRWLHTQPGGVLAIPTWGKFWLAMIGLYGYEGVNPFPPEVYILPRWLPVHPSRYYCHTRYIYLAIAYLYGSRFRAMLGSIAAELRRELYGVSYETIDFSHHRHDLTSTDLYVRPSAGLRAVYDCLSAYERIHSVSLRRRALDFCFERILYEQRTSRYQGLSPVNGLLNCLAIFARDPGHSELAPSLQGVENWKWDDELDGIRYAGARSHTWDTAFAMQAMFAAPVISDRAVAALRKAYRFLNDTQLTAEIPDYRCEDRDPALGGWCFSDGEHRWPVSDCTAEALCAVLRANASPALNLAPGERIPDERLCWAAEFILSRQNDEGGFGTYERRRGSVFLESINPSEMYGSCMTERSYIECTGSALSALSHFRATYPKVLRERIDRAVERGVRFLRSCQRPDGSFVGFWGINFTYAIFHVVKGMRAAGIPSSDPSLTRAAAWLVGKQRQDGGWGEHYSSCLEDRYVEHPNSQVVMTSWALLALMEVIGPTAEPIVRGIAWLCAQQHPDGSWPQQAVNGVFFGTAMLDYRLYKSYFPTWALARYAALQKDVPLA